MSVKDLKSLEEAESGSTVDQRLVDLSSSITSGGGDTEDTLFNNITHKTSSVDYQDALANADRASVEEDTTEELSIPDNLPDAQKAQDEGAIDFGAMMAKNDEQETLASQERAQEIKEKEDKYTPEDLFESQVQENSTPEDYNRLKDLKAAKKEFLLETPTRVEAHKILAKEHLDRDRAWYNAPGAILDYSMVATHNVLGMFTDDDSGLSEERARQYNDMKSEIASLERATVEKNILDLTATRDGIAEQYKEKTSSYSPLGAMGSSANSENSKVTDAMYIYDELIDSHKTKLNDGGNAFHNFVRQLSINTIPLVGTIRDLDHMALASKIDSGIELTPEEEILAKALVAKGSYEGSSSLEPDSYMTKATRGFVDTVPFMSDMILTRGVGAGIGKTVTKKLTGKLTSAALKTAMPKVANAATLTSKGLGAVTTAIPKAAAMPATYSSAADKYAGMIQSTTNEDGSTTFYAREGLYKKIVKENQTWKDRDAKRLQELYNKDKNETISKVESAEEKDLEYMLGVSKDNPNGLTSYKEMEDSLVPVSAAEAIRYGWTSSFNEVLSEMVGGKIMGKILPKVSNPLNRSARYSNLKKKIATNDFAEGALNRTKGIRDAASIGGIKEEYLEEIFVAPLNAWNDGSTKELEMLLTPEYHLEILSTVAFTGGFMRAPGAIGQAIRPANHSSMKAYKAQVAANLNALGTDTSNPSLAEYVDMRANKKVINVSKINNKIQALKNEGKEEEAQLLQTKMFNNIGALATGLGQEQEFKAELEGIISSKEGKYDPTLITSATVGLERIEELSKVREEYPEALNQEELISLKAFELDQGAEIKTFEARQEVAKPLFDDAMDILTEGTEWEGVPVNMEGLLNDNPVDEKEGMLFESILNSGDARIQNFLGISAALDLSKKNKVKTTELFNKKSSVKEQKKIAKEAKDTFNLKTNLQAKVAKQEEIIRKKEGLEEKRELTVGELMSLIPTVKGTKKAKETLTQEFIAAIEAQKTKEAKEVKEAVESLVPKPAVIPPVNAEVVEEVEDTTSEVTKEEEAALLKLASSVIPVGTKGEVVMSLGDKKPSTAAPTIESIEAARKAELNKELPNYGEQEFVTRAESNKKAAIDEKYDTQLEGLKTPDAKGDTAAYNPLLDDMEDEDYSLPVDTLDDTQRANSKEGVSSMVSNHTKRHGTAPTSFKAFVEALVETHNVPLIEDLYNSLVLGWKENNYAVADYKQVYNEVFEDLDKLDRGILDKMYSQLQKNQKEPTPEEIIEETKKVETEINNANTPLLTYDESGIAITAVGGQLSREAGLKLAFNSLEYEEVLEDGTLVKVTADKDGLNKGVVDFRDLINPNKYNKGDKLSAQVAPESLWSKLSILNPDLPSGRNDKGRPVYVKFDKWLQAKELADPNFRNTTAYRDNVPVIVHDSEGGIKATIHQPVWFNPYNVGNPDGTNTDTNNLTANHVNLINQGREAHSELRNTIIANGGITTLEITNKFEGAPFKLPKDAPAISIAESNPDAVVVLQVNNQLQTSKGVDFENADRIILNDPSDFNKKIPNEKNKMVNATNGHAWVMYHVDTIEKDGKKVKRYRAYKVLRKNAQGEEGVSQEDLDTSRYAYAAYLELTKGATGITGEISSRMLKQKVSGTKYESNAAQAETIASRILAETGINIRTLSGIESFVFSYTHTPTDKVTSLFASEDLTSYKQQTSRELLGNDVSMVNITEDKQVNKEFDSYEDYLKDRLKVAFKSFNVGTKEAPVYSSSLQPTITFKVDGTTPTVKSTVTTVVEEKKAEEAAAVEEAVLITDPTALIKALNDVLKGQGFDITENDELHSLPDMLDINPLAEMFNTIGEFRTGQEQDLIEYMTVQYLEHVKMETKGDIRPLVKAEVMEMADAKAESIKKILLTLDGIKVEEKDKAAVEQAILNAHTAIATIESIGENYEELSKKAFEGLRITQDINFLEEKEEEEMHEKDYNKTSFEDISKLRIGKKLKRVLSYIPQLDDKGIPIVGFLGLPKYMSSDVAYNTLMQILIDDVGIESNYQDVINRLTEASEHMPWVKAVVEELENGGGQLQNQFLYNFVRHGLTMRFSMLSKYNGEYKLQMFDTNANEIKRVILKKWETNLANVPLITKGEVVKSVAKKLREEYDHWVSGVEYIGDGKIERNLYDLHNDELQNWLSNFGIELSDSTINEIRSGTVRYKGKVLTWEDFLDAKHGLVSNLVDYLDKIESTKDDKLALEDNPYNNPHQDISLILKLLSSIESKYESNLISLSFRDNKKNISGVIAPSYVTGKVDDLIRDTLAGTKEGSMVHRLGTLAYSKHSLILKLLKNDPDFVRKLKLNHIGLTAIKELGKKGNEFSDITSLNDLDYSMRALTGFQDVRQGSVDYKKDGISMRIASMFLPTMSDKSQMLELVTGVYNFYQDSANSFKEDGSFSDTTREIVYQQLVAPELERILTHYIEGGRTTIKGYDQAAEYFMNTPSLNDVTIEGANGKAVNVREFLKAQEGSDVNIEQLEEFFKDILIDEMENTLQAQASQQGIEWESAMGGKNMFNSEYVTSNAETLPADVRRKYMVMDYILNSNIAYADMSKLFTGDPALYGKDFSEKSNYGNKTPYQVSLELGTNLGKRSALLIAPGATLANSKEEKYKQIFLADSIDISSNSDYLIQLHYGQEAYNSVKAELDSYSTAMPEEQARIRKSLSKKFPAIADFFDLETTDAQEYTTVREHVNMLWKQGRLDPKDYIKLLDTISKGGNLNKEQTKLVLQPIKPVYTDQVYDSENNLMRTVYIKSSSFPLLPGLTVGTKLDALRIKMEEIEKASPGQGVRASYGTANKVGSLKNTVDPLSQESLDGITLGSNMLELRRENFRIQQDVPFKSDSKADKVAMGTQIFKILLGDGVISENGFKIDGETKSGIELNELYDSTFKDLIELKKQDLYKELGLQDNGFPVSVEETAKKVSEMLKKESETRGFSKSDIESLDLVPLEKNGITSYEFRVPLWLHPNSNKFEALLNSVIANRIMKIKLPGASFVAGSEHGFANKVDDISEITNSSRIIYLDGWNGVELEGARKEDGEMKSAQIMVSSKFKDANGKLIDLFSVDKNGDYIYIIDTDGALNLNMDKFDSELLKNFTYRTPTSAHVSGSLVEVVGILPPESGDLMLVPKGFTKQKGLDYDVDKETAYQLNHVIENGKVSVLTQEIADRKIAELTEKLNKKEDAEPEIDALWIAIFGEELAKVDVDPDQRVAKLTAKLQEKILENTFIKIHFSVYANPSDKIQKKINSVLSMEFAGEQAEFLSQYNSTSQEEGFSLTSPMYQRAKMKLGAVGKMAIGVYSTYVTLHSLVGIAHGKGKPVQIKHKNEDGEYVNSSFTLGGEHSKGVLGLENTLGRDSRTIASAFSEKQNTATDNEKEQILARVGVNKHTIGVDSFLTLLGFDKDKAGDSIPYMFISQPIIQRFSKLSDDAFGVASTEYMSEEDIIAQLAEEFKSNATSSSLTSEALRAGLDGDITNQISVLRFFMYLKNLQKNLADKQGILNTDNLGKSILESSSLHERLEKFKSSQFYNLDTLIGTFDTEHTEGAIKVGDTYITPTTAQGQIIVNGIAINSNLWSKYFPYQSAAFQSLFDEAIPEDASSFAAQTLKEEVMQGLKRYINSRQKNGMFRGTPIEERKALFIDSADNTSLASYLQDVMKGLGEGKGVDSLRTNPFLGKFKYEVTKDGNPSKIVFDNTSSDSFNDEYLYKAFAELLMNDIALPNKNGKPYTTRMLGQELALYAYLEGGVQQAIQFVQYIPVQYLEAVGLDGVSVAEQYRMMTPDTYKKRLGLRIDPTGAPVPSKFYQQFLQHNPEKNPYKVNSETFNKEFVKNEDGSYSIIDEGSFPFISVHQSHKGRKQAKWGLLMLIGNNKYMEIDILGAHGMNEYSYNLSNAKTLIDPVGEDIDALKQPSVSASPTPALPVNNFGIETSTVAEVLANIGNSNLEQDYLSEAANMLIPLLSGDVKLEVLPNSKVAKFTNKTNTITIGVGRATSPEELAKTFVHEVIHSITAREAKQQVRQLEDGSYTLLDGASEEISSLLTTYNKYRRHIEKTRPGKMKPFIEKVNRYRKDREKFMLDGEKFSLEEREILYPAYNLDEFMTASLTSPKFMEEASTVAPIGGVDFMTRLRKIYDAIISKMVALVAPNTLAEEAVFKTLDFIYEGRNGKTALPLSPAKKTPTPSIPNETGPVEVVKHLDLPSSNALEEFKKQCK